MANIRTAVRNSSYLGIAKLYYLLIRSAYIVFFIKIIGVELYGYYTYAQNWYVLFMPLAMWGMNELLISEHIRTEEENRDELIGSGLALRLLLGTACCLGIIAAALLLEENRDLRWLIVIFSQGVLARGATTWFSSLFIARNKSIYWLYISASFMSLEVIVCLLLAYHGESLITIALVQTTLWWLTLAVAYTSYRRRFHAVSLRWSQRYISFYIKKGASVGAATFVLFCMTPGLLIMYRHLAGDVQRIGEVALVLQILQILDQLILVISNAALPELNRISDDLQSATATFSRLAWNYSFYVGGTLFLLCFALLPEAVSIFSVTEFDDAVLTFAKFSWIIIPLFAIHSLRLVLISTANTTNLLLFMVAGFSCLVTFVFALDYVDRFNTFNLFLAMGSALSIIAVLMLGFLCRALTLLRFRDLIQAPMLFLACFVTLLIAPEQIQVLAGLAASGTLSAASFLQFRKSYRSSSGLGL